MIPLLILYSLINQIYEVEGVVVTAPRFPAYLKDISASVSIIDREMLESQNPSSIGEALRNIAGIDAREYGSPGAVSSISIRGTPSSGVIVLLDGIPLNSIQTGIADISWIDINDVERIEVIKAPVSNLYGANGIGGLINIITRDGLKSNPANAGVRKEIGNVLRRSYLEEYFVNYKIPVNNFNYLIGGKKISSNGGRTNSKCSGFNFNSRLDYNRSKFKIKLGTNLNIRDYGLPGPLPRIDSLNPVPYLGDSTSTSRFDNQSDRIWLNNLILKFDIIENLSFNSSVFHNFQNNKYHTSYFGWEIVEEDYRYSLLKLGMNNSLLWEWNNDKLIIGFDYRYDTLRAEKKSIQAGDTIWYAQAMNYGYWISLMKKLFNNWTINSGFRYDQNISYGGFFSPSLGIVRDISNRLWLKFSFARAFRAPGFNDLYWPIYGNKDLKPEYGDAYEVRIESSPVYNMFTGFSLFLRDIKDRIAWLPTEGGLWKPQNVNYTRIAGAELEMHLKLKDNLKISFDGTYLFARQRNRELIYYDFMTSEMKFEEKERKTAFIPDFTLAIKIRYALAKDFLLNLSTEYTSKRVNYYENWTALPNITMDTKELKPYYLVNLNLNRIFFEHLKISAGIKNLFDISYATQFGNRINDNDYPMPKRTFFAEVFWD